MTERNGRAERTLTRRRLVGAVAVGVAGGGAGCLGGDTGGRETSTEAPPTETATSRSGDETETPSTGTTTSADGGPSLASLRVADFIEYPLAGVHPHVHNRANVQYVVVGVEPSSTAADPDAVRERLGLTLDGVSRELALEQPVDWDESAITAAFAVPKGETFDTGAVQFDERVVRSLSAATLDRLNEPPVFAVADVTVSPDEVAAGEQATATVRFTLSNTGDGVGTFGASVQGNYVSGAATVTATLDAGAEREVTTETEIIGRDDAVTVTVDWGLRVQRLTVPVVGTTATGTGTETGTEMETEAEDGAETETETRAPTAN